MRFLLKRRTPLTMLIMNYKTMYIFLFENVITFFFGNTNCVITQIVARPRHIRKSAVMRVTHAMDLMSNPGPWSEQLIHSITEPRRLPKN